MKQFYDGKYSLFLECFYKKSPSLGCVGNEVINKWFDASPIFMRHHNRNKVISGSSIVVEPDFLMQWEKI